MWRQVANGRKLQEVPTSVSSGHSSSPLEMAMAVGTAPDSPPGASAKAPGRSVPRPDALPFRFVVRLKFGRREPQRKKLLDCLTKRPALLHRPSHSLSIPQLPSMGTIYIPASPIQDPRGVGGGSSLPRLGPPFRKAGSWHRPRSCMIGQAGQLQVVVAVIELVCACWHVTVPGCFPRVMESPLSISA